MQNARPGFARVYTMSTLDDLLARVTNKALCDAQRRSDEGMPMYAEVFYSVTQKKHTRAHWSIVRGAFCQSQVCWKGREVGTPADLYFDHPGEKRAGDLVGTLLSERSSQASGIWRSPLSVMSLEESDEDETPTDWYLNVGLGTPTPHLRKVARLCEEEEVDEQKKELIREYLHKTTHERAEHLRRTVKMQAVQTRHVKLVSNTFALHLLFGPGHVLRTDGRVAAFWNGEMCRVVQLGNLVMLRVQIGRGEGGTKREARSAKSEAKVQLAMDFLRQQIGL